MSTLTIDSVWPPAEVPTRNAPEERLREHGFAAGQFWAAQRIHAYPDDVRRMAALDESSLPADSPSKGVIRVIGRTEGRPGSLRALGDFCATLQLSKIFAHSFPTKVEIQGFIMGVRSFLHASMKCDPTDRLSVTPDSDQRSSERSVALSPAFHERLASFALDRNMPLEAVLEEAFDVMVARDSRSDARMPAFESGDDEDSLNRRWIAIITEISKIRAATMRNALARFGEVQQPGVDESTANLIWMALDVACAVEKAKVDRA